jgi:hypothetical protein
MQESWMLTCSAAGGTPLGTTAVTLDKGQSASLSPCTPGPAPASLSLPLRPPGFALTAR